MNINNDNTNVNNQNEIPTQLNETMNQQLSYQPQYSPIHELLINMKILDSKVTSIEENLMKLSSRSNQHYQILESLQKDIDKVLTNTLPPLQNESTYHTSFIQQQNNQE